jgi:predicted CoA-substrate-specific enzyme activase
MGTGFGRFNIPFSHARATEPACHARGAVYRYPETRTVLDIGGQDTTAIRVDSLGNVLDFCMNDKCAAGTGRFLESIAGLLELKIEDIGDLGSKGSGEIAVTNVCSVLGEQEIINHLERGVAVEDILDAVFEALARRAASLVRRVGIEEEVTVTGGVSLNRGMVEAIEARLGLKVNAGVDGVYVGALGASLLGLERTGMRTSLKA